MIKLLLHESKRRVGSPGVFITPGTYFIIEQFCLKVKSIMEIDDKKLVKAHNLRCFLKHFDESCK